MFENSGDWNTFVAKTAEQEASGFVVPDNANRENVYTQISQVVHGVSAPARNDCTFAMPQNQDRSFARDAGNVAEDKFVGNHIAEYGKGDAWE